MFSGGVIAYPTEAVWGLGCDPFNHEAVARLLALKHRPVHKGLILIAADIDTVASTFPQLSADDLQRMQRAEEPTSWLIPHHNQVPWWITGQHDTVAVRVTTHGASQQLCRSWGGLLVSTSANPAGAAPALTRLKTRCYFGDRVDYYLPGEVGRASKPSSIIELSTGTVLR